MRVEPVTRVEAGRATIGALEVYGWWEPTIDGVRCEGPAFRGDFPREAGDVVGAVFEERTADGWGVRLAGRVVVLAWSHRAGGLGPGGLGVTVRWAEPIGPPPDATAAVEEAERDYVRDHPGRPGR